MAGAVLGGAIAASAARPPDPNWVAFCSRHYRTFDPNTGMYLGADGRQYLCH